MVIIIVCYFAHVLLERRVHFNFDVVNFQREREQVLVQVHCTSSRNASLA